MMGSGLALARAGPRSSIIVTRSEAGPGAGLGAGAGTDEFEKRGVSIALFRAVAALALERDATPGAWSIGAVSARLVGNHEVLKPDCRWGSVDLGATLTHAARSSLIDVLQLQATEGAEPTQA